METVADRIETSRRTLREQLVLFTDRTRQAGLAFAEETRGASVELAEAFKGEAEAWSKLITAQTGKLLPASNPTAAPKKLSTVEVDALERRLLVGLRDMISRVDAKLQSRLEEKPASSDDAPIDGYDDMSAKAIVSLIAELEPSAVEAVAAYEAANKGRKTVLKATERAAA
ncbi:MAG: hypothetical protein JJ863_05220 [Deltaproteobacteria bacterium]|nr:hypothetical protein [Deltaproteobacteria bacterium]